MFLNDWPEADNELTASSVASSALLLAATPAATSAETSRLSVDVGSGVSNNEQRVKNMQ